MVSIAAVVVLGKDISVGGPRDGDSAVHAMDGVLIHDWVAAGPKAWLSPIEFAERQYTHYPSLGIGRHYPPGFAMVEAAFFAIFGISAFSARLCVVFFGLVAVAGTYTFMRPVADRSTSALAAVIFVTMPAVTLWGRQTMLELPTLAVLIWGAVTFTWYLRRPNWTRFLVLLAVALLSIAFRQTGVLLLGALTLTLMICALRGTVRTGQWLCSLAAAGAVITAVTLSLDDHGATLLRGHKTFPDLWSLDALTFYLREIPGQTGLVILLAAGVGFVLSLHRLKIEWVFLGSWVLVCYVMLTVADYKNPRFFLVGLFPFAVWAGLGVGSLLARLPIGRVRVAATSAASFACCAVALAAPVAHRPDYGAVVAANQDKIESRPVLFSGIRDGDFVFAVRQHIPWRNAMVIRGSKLLYTCTAHPNLDLVSYVSSPEALGELMDRFAFEYVFVERENKLGIAEDAMLRSYLAGAGSYRGAASFPLKAEATPSRRDVTIDVYEAIESGHRAVDHFDIPIPRARRTIRADLEGWMGT